MGGKSGPVQVVVESRLVHACECLGCWLKKRCAHTQAYFGDNMRWMEGVKSLLSKLLAENRAALDRAAWMPRIWTFNYVLDDRGLLAFERMHYIWRPRMCLHMPLG